MVPGLAGASTTSAERSPAACGEALVRLLAAVAPAGAVVVLEDLHWADAETLAVLDHLADNLDRAPALCIATVRDEEPSAALDLARRVGARRGALVLDLARLAPPQVAAMIHACGASGDLAAVERVTAAADGLPFLVEELLAAPGVPTTFAQTVQRRLDALPDGDRAVLEAAATMGRQLDWRLLAPAVDRSEAEVVVALERAVAALLVEVDGSGFRFRHALTRDAVLAGMVPPRRAAVAERVLAAADALPPGAPPVSAELRSTVAELAGRHDQAAALLVEIGHDALQRGAAGSAGSAFERARSLDPAGDAARPLVTAYAMAGRVDDAFAVGRALLGTLEEGAVASLHLELARAAIATARWPLAEAQLHALRTGGAPLDPELAADAAVCEAHLAFATLDERAAAAPMAAALEAADAAGRADLSCEALLLLGRAERLRSLEAAEARFQAAAELADRHDLTVWRLHARHELGTIALLDRGQSADLYVARQAAESLGALSTLAVIDLQLAAAASTVGDDAGHEWHARACAELGRRVGHPLLAARAEMFLAVLAAQQDDEARMEGHCAAARVLAPDEPITAAMREGLALPVLEIVRERRAAAIAAFDQVLDELFDPQMPPVPSRGLWPLLLAVEGDPGAAEAVRVCRRAGGDINVLNRGLLAYADAVLVGSRDGRRAEARFDDGERALERATFFRHVGRRLVAEAALREGWGDPRRWLPETAAHLRSRGLATMAEACEALLAGPSLPPGWTRLGITRREGDVLRLVVAGLTNKEIAGELAVSPRTVEKHVEALLRKAEARTRTELAAKLGGATT
jgi:DNA-binding CsgD family transcriptional regulator